MRYTLWHIETGNLIGDFDSEDAALAAVREEIRANDAAADLILQREDPQPALVAEGEALSALAFGADQTAVV